MSARSFKSVGWVLAVGGAALGCYMVSLNVASERADLARVEREILLAKRDIRSLQTELGTRGRLQQLEQWNAEVLALSAPMPGQFVDSEVRLASLPVPQATIEDQVGEVHLASAEPMQQIPAKPAVDFKPAPDAIAGKSLVHRASLVLPSKSPLGADRTVEVKVPTTKAEPAKKTAAPKPVAAAAKPVPKPVIKEAAAKIAVPKAAAAKTPAAKPVKTATAAPASTRKPASSFLDDSVLREINVAAGSERKGAKTAR